MKRNTLVLEMLVLTAAMLITGCSTTQGANIIDDSVAMGILSPDQSRDNTQRSKFYLGAGDALGRDIFFNYVAYVRANPSKRPHYAIVETNSDMP
ncbi:MAG: hypothetical protein IH984_14030 [Planctomycetes bacterium]|nr:hypothetical protein [Planctomycetota bacterium]